MRISLLGHSDEYRLESFYRRAFESLGHEVQIVSPEQLYRQEIPNGFAWKTIAKLRPRQAWRNSANRNAMLELLRFKPELVVAFCNVPFPIGSWVYLRSRLPATKTVLLWPDTLFNLQPSVAGLHSVFDAVATYGDHTLAAFTQLGFRNVFWLPLGADDEFHFSEAAANSSFDADVCFVGGWRPEREAMMESIRAWRPELKLAIHGPLWKDKVASAPLKSCCQSDGLVGQDYAQASQKSRVNMNIIDETNYPAANMRFFELPMAGALQLASHCPEMESIYVHRKHVLYYHDEEDLLAQVQWALENEKADQIRLEAQKFTVENHSYTVRARQLLERMEQVT